MKVSIFAVSLMAGSTVGAAVRNMDDLLSPLNARALDDIHEAVLNPRQNRLAPQGEGALPLVPPPFDAAQQLVSTKAPNDFRAPGRNDQRGPCPGLNAMANHGYIPRNGVASIQQFREGTQKVFGMASVCS